MNAGAAQSEGDAFLFLHADTHLPAGALAAVRRTLADPAVVAGTFRLRFDRPTPLLRLYAAATRLPWTRLAFGDRGLFVRRTAFEAVGGFPDWPIFEDLEIVRRLATVGRFRFLPEAVVTSARRFRQHGTARQQLRNLRLWWHYVNGGAPEDVAAAYSYARPPS
jgi:GT2 family glycosyltransferase